MKRRITYILAAVTAVVSCSVKEDRVDCPCWLDYHLQECSREAITVSAWNEGQIFIEPIDIRDYAEFYERTVPKGMVTTAVFSGKTRMAVRRDSLVIARGFECDSIWAHHNLVDCNWEFAHDTVRLHKQYSTVHLKMDNDKDEPYPFRLVVRSNICGLDFKTNEPLYGAFEVELKEWKNNNYEFRIPRQADDSMTMDIYRGEELLNTLPFGKTIAEAMREENSFTWNSLDLGDIYIGVDYARTRVTVSVEPWDSEEIPEIVI